MGIGQIPFFFSLKLFRSALDNQFPILVQLPLSESVKVCTTRNLHNSYFSQFITHFIIIPLTRTDFALCIFFL